MIDSGSASRCGCVASCWSLLSIVASIFNSVERKRCFDFPTPLPDIATSLRTAGNQLVFLLSCGYFKATKRFYPVPTFHRRDLTYVADRIAVALERSW